MYDFLRDRGVDGVIVQKLKDEKVQCFDMLYALTFHRLKKADDFGWFFFYCCYRCFRGHA